MLKGGDGADGFSLTSQMDLGRKKADTIKDFDSGEGDAILVNKDIFGLGNKIKFKRVRGIQKQKLHRQNHFIYDCKRGSFTSTKMARIRVGRWWIVLKLQDKPDLYRTLRL